MRRLLIVALLFSFAATVEAGRHCIFRVHVAANANDTDRFAQPVHSRTGRDVFVEKTPWLTEREVRAFCPFRAADGSYSALLYLDDHGRTILDTESVERRGSLLFVFINGRPLCELLVDRRVSDGKIYLPYGLSADDIKLMNKDWKLMSHQKK
jgi:hypothetical protein